MQAACTQTRAAVVQTPRLVAVDAAQADVLLLCPHDAPRQLVYWLPAMGVPARHYLPLAHALAGHGVAVALHEWRGIGSSDRRASRTQNWGYHTLLADDLPAGLAAVRARLPECAIWLGGHSLGGQMAVVYAGLQPSTLAGLVVVASGAPYWRCFRWRVLVGMAYALAPLLAACVGYLPGRRIGFGGNEARGVIADWSRSGRRGRYVVDGVDTDIEAQLALVECPLLAVTMRDDWLAPPASLRWLLGEVPRTLGTVVQLNAQQLQTRADHFSWMKHPTAVAALMARWLGTSESAFTRRPPDAQ